MGAIDLNNPSSISIYPKNFEAKENITKAIEEYNMIEENDKIAICLSGGKDSITMLHAFKNLQIFYPKKFDIIAISIDPGFEFFDTNFLQELCDKLEIP